MHFGSPEHYAHFLLGYLLPLAKAMDHLREPRFVYVRSCAIFDEITRSLGYDSLIFMDRHKLMDWLLSLKVKPNGVPVWRVTLDGFDGTAAAGYRLAINEAAALIQARLAGAISTERNAILQRVPKKAGPIIVLINRGPAHPHYSSPGTEAAGAGLQRRSIRNFTQMRDALLARHDRVIVDVLEGKSLAYQIALFQLADIVVAQHGAALANLVWSRESTAVLEIMPRQRVRPRDSRFFVILATELGQNYKRIDQTDIHGDVDVGGLLQTIERVSSFAAETRDASP